MNTQSLSDKELVIKILSGHPDLFSPLVERHIRAAHAVAYARLGNAADAEDAVQEAFLRAYERLATLREPAKFAAWVLTIARHEAARVAVQRRRVLPEVSTDDASGEANFDRAELAAARSDPAQREMNEILRGHVMQLPEASREVLLLHYFAGHSAREIADLLSLRRAAVLKRLQRAREQLAETMLRDLEAARPAPRDFAPQVARILALSAGIKLATGSTVPVAAAAGFGLGALLTKPAVIAVLIATAGVVTGFSILSATAPTPDMPIVTAPMFTPAEQSAESLVAAPRQPEPELPSTIPATSATADTALASTASLQLASTAAEEEKRLTGPWRMWYLKADDPVPREGDGRDFELRQTGTIVHFREKDENSPAVGEGQLANGRLSVKLRSGSPPQSIANDLMTLEGDCDPASDQMLLRGTLTSPERAYQRVTDGEERLIQPYTISVVTRWQRISSDMLSKEAFIEARKKEMRQLAKAIFDFPQSNGGRFPQRIEELVPAFLATLQPYRSEAGVQLTFRPPSPRPKITDIFPNYSDVVGPDPAYGKELNYQQRFIAVENAQKKYWGDRFVGAENIVEAVYDQYDLTLVITDDGVVGKPDEVSCRQREKESPAIFIPETTKVNVAKCHNNLKQAGLSLKMFANEVPAEAGERLPGGWLMIYPEYMPDRCVLVCPGAKEPKVSYEILFPGTSTEELEAAYSRLVPSRATADRAYKWAHIPIVIELDECSGSGGRNVLFLDGHTEHRPDRLEGHSDLAPFLKL